MLPLAALQVVIPSIAQMILDYFTIYLRTQKILRKMAQRETNT